MSMQVSYKKQILFFLLGLLIILASIEIGARVYEQAVEDCFYLNSDATKNLDFITGAISREVFRSTPLLSRVPRVWQ